MMQTGTTPKYVCCLIGLLASIATAQPTTAPAVLAFPTAEGFGAYAKGGRGGKVIFVTNLNDSGPGSFRAACEETGPRTIIFRVSGTIPLTRRLTIREPYLTIAGQTAPGDGICISGQDVLIQTHDVIVRHIRFRPGDLIEGERDALSIVDGQNIIIDHCSASWGNDEQLSTTKASKNVTVQWCIIGAALHNAGHNKGNHGYGGIIQGEALGYHHNLYVHNRSRNPRPQSGFSDFRNNVVYDWNGMAGYAEDNAFRFNFVANYYKAGPSTLQDRNIAFHTGKQRANMYSNGNVLDGVVAEGQSDGPIIKVRNGGIMVDKEFDFGAPVKTETATQAYTRVLDHAGATLPRRDSYDQRVVTEVRTGGGKHIDSQKDVGGWPELKSQPAPADADNDGMPDAWETKEKLNPNDAADRNLDADRDGYTNLEEYLNSVAL